MFQEALESYDNVLELDPKSINALNNKGGILRKLGKYYDALKCCNKALEIDPNDAHILQQSPCFKRYGHV